MIAMAGMIFPFLSLFTGIMALIDRWRYKKNSSVIFVPFVGPVLASGAIAILGRHLWLIPVVWLTDIGTLYFLWISPRLIREWWALSRFTQIAVMEGSHENQTARLSLHSSGMYLLKKRWRRMPGETGIVELGEFGTYTPSGDGYELTAHFGLRRGLRARGGGVYGVEQGGISDTATSDYSLKDWQLGTQPLKRAE